MSRQPRCSFGRLLSVCDLRNRECDGHRSRARSAFAVRKRLKDMRTRRGFDRARYFAKSLGIEENRYTRYERAEVEPSLTLIHKMCETLRVSPNELLGFGECRGPVSRRRPGHGGGCDGSNLWSTRPGRGWRQGPTLQARSPGVWLPRRSRFVMSRAASPRRRATRCGRCRKRARCSAGCRPTPSAPWPRLLDGRSLKDADPGAQGQAGRADPRLHRERDRAAPTGVGADARLFADLAARRLCRPPR